MSYTTAELVEQTPAIPEPARTDPRDRRDPATVRHRLEGVEANLGTLYRAKVVDISLGGAGIETMQYLRVGRSYPFRFNGPSGKVLLDAKVVWSRLTETVVIGEGEIAPVFRTGLQFLGVSGEQEGELQALVAAHAAPDA